MPVLFLKENLSPVNQHTQNQKSEKRLRQHRSDNAGFCLISGIAYGNNRDHRIQHRTDHSHCYRPAITKIKTLPVQPQHQRRIKEKLYKHKLHNHPIQSGHPINRIPKQQIHTGNKQCDYKNQPCRSRGIAILVLLISNQPIIQSLIRNLKGSKHNKNLRPCKIHITDTILLRRQQSGKNRHCK